MSCLEVLTDLKSTTSTTQSAMRAPPSESNNRAGWGPSAGKTFATAVPIPSNAFRTRLVALDFVLTHLQYEYLEIEDDKLGYFCQQLDIPIELLPGKRYSGAVHNRTTERYFVDKLPMFLCAGSFSSPVVTFTFVDPGLGILDSFKTHLLACGSLFEALSDVRLVYVSPRPTQFETARKTFLATAGRPPKVTNVLDEFPLRQLLMIVSSPESSY